MALVWKERQMSRQKGSGQGHAQPGKTGAEGGFHLKCQSGKDVRGVTGGSDSLVQHGDQTLPLCADEGAEVWLV